MPPPERKRIFIIAGPNGAGKTATRDRAMTNDNGTERLTDAGLQALAQAARDAVDLGKRTGTPVWVWRDDQWVNLLAEPTDEEIALVEGA